MTQPPPHTIAIPVSPAWLVFFRGLQPEDIGIGALLAGLPPAHTYDEATAKLNEWVETPATKTQIITSVAKLVLAYEHQGEELPAHLASLDGAQ